MARIDNSIKKFLDAVTRAMTDVAWLPRGAGAENLEWRSCALTIDPDCRFYAGATSENWEGFDFKMLVDAVEYAAAARFGSRVTCIVDEKATKPPEGGVEALLEMLVGGPIELVLSPQLAEALGVEPEPATAAETVPTAGVDMLMHVEIPVSVSLGRTRMRMKDLLVLSQGSVVELDQELGDSVEVRVNNCVIARGEVVAVDGNYGVRILEMVSNAMGTPVLK